MTNAFVIRALVDCRRGRDDKSEVKPSIDEFSDQEEDPKGIKVPLRVVACIEDFAVEVQVEVLLERRCRLILPPTSPWVELFTL